VVSKFRPVLFELRNRFRSVGRVGYQLHVGFGADQCGDPLTKHRMVTTVDIRILAGQSA
jgi:hypothetical protein